MWNGKEYPRFCWMTYDELMFPFNIITIFILKECLKKFIKYNVNNINLLNSNDKKKYNFTASSPSTTLHECMKSRWVGVGTEYLRCPRTGICCWTLAGAHTPRLIS